MATPVFDTCVICGIKGLLRGDRPESFTGPALEVERDDDGEEAERGFSRCIDRETCELAAEIAARDPL